MPVDLARGFVYYRNIPAEHDANTRERPDPVGKTRSFLSFSRRQNETANNELEQLRRSVHELKILSDLAFAIGGSSEPEEIVETLVDRLMHAVEAEQAVVTLLDEDEQDPMKTSIRLRATSAVDNAFRLSDSILGWMYLHKEALMVNDPKTDDRFKRVKWDESIRSVMCVPLMIKSKLTGLLTLYNKKVGPGFTADDQRLLTIIAAQSAQLIENAKLYQESLKFAQVKAQQKSAYEIQRNLLPDGSPEIAGYDIAGASTPAQTVGGDYYDFIDFENGRWAICLGDVSGKGIPASLLMANLQATLRAQTLSPVNVDEVVKRANTLMSRSTGDERFVTLFYSELDTATHELAYCNAGHEQPVHLSVDGSIARLDSTGIAVGVLDGYPYTMNKTTLQPGDAVVIFTDGVTDATTHANEMFEYARLEQSIQRHRSKSAVEMIESIFADVRSHVGNAPQFDDLTLVVIKRDA